MVLCCLFCFGVRVSLTFHLKYVCSYYFSSVSVVKKPLFGKELLTRFTICSLCIWTIVILVILVLRAEDLILIATVPDICILFYFKKKTYP